MDDFNTDDILAKKSKSNKRTSEDKGIPSESSRKKSSGPSPTSRTLKLLKSEGKVVDVSEKWNSFTCQRKDLFGFIDIVALEDGITWGIQCTSTGNVAARIKKICNECRETAFAWLKAGNRIEVIGWSKKGEKGKRKLWTATRHAITIEDLNL